MRKLAQELGVVPMALYKHVANKEALLDGMVDVVVAEIAMAAGNGEDSVAGRGCDEQFEFEFALDLLLDGFDRLRQQGWTSASHPTERTA